MVHLRDAASNFRTKISKINDAISIFRDPPPPSQYQHQKYYDQQTPEDDEDETLSTLHRLVLARKRAATSFSNSSSTPPPASPPTDHHSGTAERTTKVMESIFTTVFGVCTGTQHDTCSNTGPQCPTSSMYYCDPSNNHNHRRQNSRDVLESMQRRNRKPHTLPTMIIQSTPSPSHNEQQSPKTNGHKKNGHNHRQHQHRRQSIHHATPVPATQFSIPTSAKDGNHRRRESARRRINVITPRKAEKNRIARTNNAVRDSNKETMQEHINVGGMPYRLTEVQSSRDAIGVSGGLEYDEKEDSRSYSYDDGISALSAHTLEDMAERELFLNRQRGIPAEEGFDIRQDGDVGGGASAAVIDSNPNMSLEDSALNSSMLSVKTDTDLVECSHGEQDQSKEECAGGKRSTYPVQMARNRSAISNVTGSSNQSSKSDFSDVWKRQDQQHWMQVQQDNGPTESSATSQPAKKVDVQIEEKKPTTTKQMRTPQHPHETMLITASDVVPQKKKKKNRSRALFGRRKGYITYEEESNIEHSPIRIKADSYAEV